MNEPLVVLDKQLGVGSMTLNCPDNLNALNPPMAAAMWGGLKALTDDDAVRVIVINGAGRAFMAGGDIRFFATLIEQEQATDSDLTPMFDTVHQFIKLLRSTGKPVVASVHGAVAGFGLSVVQACDMAIAAQNTVFTLAYCHLGVSPDGGSTWTLPRRVGLKNAFELALLGDRLPAERAADMGLINRIVDDGELANSTNELAMQLAAGPPQATARAKALLNASFDRTLDEQLTEEEVAFAASVQGEEFREGVSAFLEKRRPQFTQEQSGGISKD